MLTAEWLRESRERVVRRELRLERIERFECRRRFGVPSSVEGLRYHAYFLLLSIPRHNVTILRLDITALMMINKSCSRTSF